jgi:hypothetical protein
MSTPSAALGPESVLMKPILTRSAARDESEAAAIDRNIAASRIRFMGTASPAAETQTICAAE